MNNNPIDLSDEGLARAWSGYGDTEQQDTKIFEKVKAVRDAAHQAGKAEALKEQEQVCIHCKKADNATSMYRCFDCKAWLCYWCFESHCKEGTGNPHVPHPKYVGQYEAEQETLQQELREALELLSRLPSMATDEQTKSFLAKHNADAWIMQKADEEANALIAAQPPSTPEPPAEDTK